MHLGYVDQSRDSLEAGKTVWEEISGGNEVIYLGKREMLHVPIFGAFNFKGPDQQKRSPSSQAASGTACIWRRC